MKQYYDTKFLTLGGIIALLLSLLLFGALILSALYNQYREMQISIQSHTGTNIAQHISRIARLGIEPDRIADLQSKIESFITHANKDTKILVLDDKTKQILALWNYSAKTESDTPNKNQPRLSIPDKLTTEQTKIKSFTQDDTLWLVFPVFDRKENTIAQVLLGIDNENFTNHIKILLNEQVIIFVSIAVLACLLLIFLCILSTRHINRKKIPQMGREENYMVFSSLLLPLLLAQLLVSFAVKGPLENLQRESFQIAAENICASIIQDIDHIQNMGTSIGEIQLSFAAYMQKIQKQFSWLKGIEFIEHNTHYFFKDGKIISKEHWKNEIKKDDIVSSYSSERQSHTLKFLCSTATIRKNLFSLLLDTLTITIISFVFMVEMLNFLLLKEEQKQHAPEDSLSNQPKFMRTIIFLCIFGTSMPISFLPMRMAEISSDLFGLPKDVIMSLPVSLEPLATGLAIFFGGMIAEKKGWRPLMLWGCILVTIGSIGSGMATNALVYIVSRFLSGFGYGYLYLMAMTFIILKSAQANRSENFSSMFAGIYAGCLCGGAFGGLIADRFSYSIVFYVIAIIVLILGIAVLCLTPKETVSCLPKQTNNDRKIGLGDILRFIFDRKMFGLLVLHIIPFAFISKCLFEFYVPVMLNNAEVSPANIGRVTMVFCLVITYLGPHIGTLIDKCRNKALWIFLANLICISAILTVAHDNLPAIVMGVLLLGICESIICSSQGPYTLEIPATKQFGESKAVTVFNMAERLGQILGPITLGVAISIFNASTALYGMAGIFFVMCILFIVNANFKK